MYIVYEKSTGRILNTLACDEDCALLEVNALHDIKEIPPDTKLLNKYVLNDAVIVRPLFPIVVGAQQLDINIETVISGIPVGTSIIVNSDVDHAQVCNDGDTHLTFQQSGECKICLCNFPYQTTEVLYHVN